MRRHLTYANVVATLALFLVVGGGGAYAAAKLARDSVGSKQIRDHSIKLRDLGRSLTGGGGASGANGLQGPKGDAGPPGTPGAPGAPGKDLSFDGIRMTGLERHDVAPPEAEITLGEVAGAELIGKCFKGSDVFTEVYVRRRAEAQGQLVVYGGTSAKGFTVLPKAGDYYLIDDESQNGFEPDASQWAITLATSGGDVYDIRGLTYRQTGGASFAPPAGDACFMTQAQIEKVSA